MTTYQQILEFILEKLPMYSRIGAAAYKTDLTNTIALCNAIGNPQHQIKTIHIAGTNGKGSTSHMLAAVLQQAGYRTGLYTSPHLKDFRERIKLNGIEIEKQFVVDFINKILPEIEKFEPSFFEITVAMAFDYFASQKVDIAIIETGLGGRLDSTNIIQPMLCIITNIGYDHQNILGNTLAAIATEKAGIIKKNTPIIIGETIPETKPIFVAKAILENAPIQFAEDDIKINSENLQIENSIINVTNTLTNVSTTYTLDLNGIYQTKNIKAVLLAIDYLTKNGYNITLENTQYALANVKKINGLYGRWQVIQQQPLVVLDVAHNVDGIQQLLLQLNAFNQKKLYNNLHIILGMVKDKDIATVLMLLPTTATYYFTQASIPRALQGELLQQQATTYQLVGHTYATVNVALAAAKQSANTNDIIIVCGSIFLVGEVEL